MRLTRWLLPLLLACGPTLAQQQVQPMVLKGTSPPSSCAVGGGTGTACPIPVVVEGGGVAQTVNIQATNGDALTDTSNALDVNIKTSSLTNQAVNLSQVNGSTTPVGAGAASTAGTQRVAVAQDATTMGGSPIPATSFEGNVTSTKNAANASPTILRSYMLYNGNTSVCYLQFFNLASANVTVGSTAPTFFVGVPANGGANFALVYNFSTAMTIAATTTATGSTNCTNGIDTSLIQN